MSAVRCTADIGFLDIYFWTDTLADSQRQFEFFQQSVSVFKPRTFKLRRNDGQKEASENSP
jgi:hypothetical protein